MSNSLSNYQPTDSKPLHITLAVPRILKSDGIDYTYYQSVCSCGWSGDYKASKLTAQEDKCPESRCSSKSPRWGDSCVLPAGHTGDHESKLGSWSR